MILNVWRHHRVIRQHPAGSTVATTGPAGREAAVVTEPDGTTVRYEHGEWHAVLTPGPLCVSQEDDPDCPVCHPQESDA